MTKKTSIAAVLTFYVLVLEKKKKKKLKHVPGQQ